jgi:leucyl/phenylalanyl-tRNA--protein transferase
MPIYKLNESLWFPPSTEFEADQDIIAIGGDVSFERLLEAYQNGIFPWYNAGDPITWFSPRMRMVLHPSEIKVSKSARNLRNRKQFEIKADTCFEAVIDQCQTVKRAGQEGTWLNNTLKQNILELHYLGYAHSIEAFENDKLVGGLYGLSVGKFFCGDSMFSLVSNASKLAFIELCKVLEQQQFELIDCQVYNTHLASLGAYEVTREVFLRQVEINHSKTTSKGSWTSWFE